MPWTRAIYYAEAYGASPGATYATNKAAIQAALTAANAAGGGTVSITTPGVYKIGGTIVIYSNTEFHIGAGVTLRQETSAIRGEAGRNLIANNAYANGSSVAITSITSSGRTCTATATAHGLAVGDWALIYGVATDGYGGIHQVVTVADADTFTYLARRNLGATPAVASAYTGFNSLQVRKCDVNISITGHGTIDYDDTNTVTGLTSLHTHNVIMAGVHNLKMEGVHSVNALKYCIFLSGVRKGLIQGCYTEGPSDGIHPCGNIIDLEIIAHGAGGGDNNIGLGTIDYTGYNIFPGKNENIKIRSIDQHEGIGVRMFGSAEHDMRQIEIYNVFGANEYADVPSIDIARDTSCVGGGLLVVKDLMIHNAFAMSSLTGALTQLTISAAVENVVYESSHAVFPSTTYGRFIQLNANAILGNLKIRNLQIDSGHSIVNITAGATIQNIFLDNVVASCQYAINNAANDAFNVFVSNCVLTNAGGSFRETSSTGKMTIHAVNTTCSVWLQRSGTQTFVSKSPLVQVDVAAANPWLDVGAGNMAYNTNAAAGTLGQAGSVIYDTVRAVWVLMANTTLTS